MLKNINDYNKEIRRNLPTISLAEAEEILSSDDFKKLLNDYLYVIVYEKEKDFQVIFSVGDEFGQVLKETYKIDTNSPEDILFVKDKIEEYIEQKTKLTKDCHYNINEILENETNSKFRTHPEESYIHRLFDDTIEKMNYLRKRKKS